MENKTVLILTNINTLLNAVIWEINNGEPLNDGINRQLFFLIDYNKFGGE